MTPAPTAIGLWICERVVIEQGTKNPNIIAAIDGLGVEQFPARPLPFSVFSTLTDAVGRGTISLRACSLQSGDVIIESLLLESKPCHSMDAPKFIAPTR